MVIQRWQSVLLLFSIICTVIFLFMPFGGIVEGNHLSDLNPFCYASIWAPASAAALLQLIAIFSFKSLKMQKSIIWISCLLIVACGASAVILSRGANCEYYLGGNLMLAASLVLSLMAIAFIRKDQKTLSSLDRLR